MFSDQQLMDIAKRFHNGLIRQSTNGEYLAEEYKQDREILMSDDEVAQVLFTEAKRNREVDSFTRAIRARFQHYNERRLYIDEKMADVYDCIEGRKCVSQMNENADKEHMNMVAEQDNWMQELCIQGKEIRKRMKPAGGFFGDQIKVIYKDEEFIKWASRLRFRLQNLNSHPIFAEVIEILDHFNGYRDETQYDTLMAKIEIIAENFDDLIGIPAADGESRLKLKKGTVVKTAFSSYTLVGQVGQGGNARVFSATNEDGERVAIKFLGPHINPEQKKRIKNEIMFCFRNRHLNIIPVFDVGFDGADDDEIIFYVMPLYAETLRTKLRQGLAHKEAIEIIKAILEGLAFVHGKGIIHRDIKPENILFAKGSSVPIIADFGIAHFSEEELATAVKTKDNARMANFIYAAPEQRVLDNKRITFASDLFAVGLVLNEMFTGVVPQSDNYRRIKDVAVDYEYFDEIVSSVYKQDPMDRVQSAEDLLAMINGWCRE